MPVTETIRSSEDLRQTFLLEVERLGLAPIWARINLLSCSTRDVRFSGALVSYLEKSETSEILSRWSEDSNSASYLYQLSQVIRSHADYVSDVRPFAADQKVSVQFRRFTKEHYLASLAACRRAIPAGHMADWTERLRAYILVRAVDALEAGAIRESRLMRISGHVREVCESEFTDKSDWIPPLVGTTTTLPDFESEVVLQATNAESAQHSPSREQFYKDLIWIATKNSWTSLPIAEQGFQSTPQAIPPPLVAIDWSRFFSELDNSRHSDPESTVELSSSDVTAVRSDPAESQI